jgi:hypothetical protein
VSDDDGGANTYDGTVATLNVAPTATLVAPASIPEAGTIAFSLAGATDASAVDAAALTFAYACTATGGWQSSATTSFTCPTTNDGAYTVRGRVSDKDGGVNEYSSVVQVTNVAPTVAGFAGATILEGESYAATSSFTDPGADVWTALANYGDGTGDQPLALSGTSFALAHAFLEAGVFTVTTTVNDGVASGAASATVTVESPAQGVAHLMEFVDALAAGTATPATLTSTARRRPAPSDGLRPGEIQAMRATLNAASRLLDRGQGKAASVVIRGFALELQLLVRRGRIEASVAAPGIAYAERVSRSAAL